MVANKVFVSNGGGVREQSVGDSAGLGVGNTIPSDLPAKKQALLVALCTHYTLAPAAESIGVSRQAVMQWIRDDQVFADAYYDTIEANYEHIEANHIIHSKDHKYERNADFMANISVLAARKPEYRSNTKVTISTEKSVVTSLDDMLSKAKKVADAE